MSININAASADIDLAVGQAIADATPGKRIVVFHLTNGFSLSRVEDLGGEPDPAFSAIGHFKVTLGSQADLNGWQFGFIQLCKMHGGSAYYAGRIRKEGSIAVMFENAMPARLLLDSKPDRTPWTIKDPRFQLNGNEINCPTGDHPALKVPRVLRNSGRHGIPIDNYLFHVIDNREFWSVLTAIDPTGKKQHLAHFHWQISHNVKFSWQNGNPRAVSKQCTFTVHGKGKGAPMDTELQGLLANPVPPQFNIASGTAVIQAFAGARGVNRSENDTWFNNVPPDFFT